MIYAEKCGKCLNENVFSHKNDVQSVAIGNRRHLEIKLYHCDIHWSCSSDQRNL